MPAIKIRVPRADLPFYGDGPLSVAVKAKLAGAIESIAERAAPEVIASSTHSDSVTIWISDAQQQAIDALARTHAIDGSGPTASGLLHAWATAEHQPAPEAAGSAAETTLDKINRAFGNMTRQDQGRFFTALSSEITSHKCAHGVIFAEASTGVGKTRAFLATALDWCEAHSGEHAVISAPSYNVLLQIIDQMVRIEAIHPCPAWQVLVGQQEFVSRQALERVLDENPDTPGADLARRWITAGGTAPSDDPVGHKWLLRSLRVATAFAWTLEGEVVLDSDASDEDDGMRAYRAQFHQARASAIVFCTHAMLATEVRALTVHADKHFAAAAGQTAAASAWASLKAMDEEERRLSRTWEVRNDLLREWVSADAGRLPSIGLLIVDEAHLLEQSFALVFASGASITRLMRDLHSLRETAPRYVSAADIEAMTSLWHDLREIGKATGGERQSTAGNAAVSEAIAGVRKTLGSIVDRLRSKAAQHPEVRHLRAVRLALDLAAKANGERYGMRAVVSWSPNVHWPSIQVGRYDVSRELDFLWSLTVSDKAVLVSGTLYDDVSREGLENIRRILGVRSTSVRPMIPVRPQWLYDPVTLHLAGDAVHADGVPRFRRPAKRDRLDPLVFAEREERWRSDITDYLTQTYETAAGGVLVLLTAHSERQAISERLDGRIPYLLTQSGSLESARMEFLRLAAQGKRPCLLAVGAAWTGLDISGDGLSAITGESVSARHDNVLTDLIIPTAPIGTNRSLTHEWRRERTGMIAEIGASAIMFRQGVGRLVRREGVPANRRLHFLDARIHEAAWNPLLSPIMRALTPYTHRETV